MGGRTWTGQESVSNARNGSRGRKVVLMLMTASGGQQDTKGDRTTRGGSRWMTS